MKNTCQALGVPSADARTPGSMEGFGGSRAGCGGLRGVRGPALCRGAASSMLRPGAALRVGNRLISWNEAASRLRGSYVEALWKLYGSSMEALWKLYGSYVEAQEVLHRSSLDPKIGKNCRKRYPQLSTNSSRSFRKSHHLANLIHQFEVRVGNYRLKTPRSF